MTIILKGNFMRFIPQILISALFILSPVFAVDFPITETDDQNIAVTLNAPPQRIVSLAPSNTEILFALGLNDRVVGVTEYCDYPPEAAQKTQVGGFSKSSLEAIVSLQPDLVLAARLNPLDLLDGLRALDIPVFAVGPTSLDDALFTLYRVGWLTGTKQAADSLVASLDERKTAIQTRIQKIVLKNRPRVLWGMLKAPMYTSGAKSFIDDLIRLSGGTNLGAQAGSGWPQVGLETLVTWNPQVIITSSDPGKIQTALTQLQQIEGWKEIEAIQNSRVYHIHPSLLQRPGPRVIDALEILANRLHPQTP